MNQLNFWTKSKQTVKAFKTKSSLQNHGIVLLNHNDIQQILKNSGPVAKNNEFQIHYWMLTFRFRAQDNSILDIGIPTCFFNSKHQVSPAHIDFELTDVIEVSQTVVPLHNMKTNEIMNSSFQADIEQLFNVKFEAIATEVNSMHRHPGSSNHQAFSSTDYRNDSSDLGVVFPLASASNDRSNFAGIMAIDDGVLNIAHYEYRTANGKMTENLTYVKGKCTAIISKDATKPSAIQEIFGDLPEPQDYMTHNESKSNPIFEDLLYLFKQLNFSASTDAILPNNVEAKHNQTKLSAKSTTKQENLFMNNYTVGIDEDDYKDAKLIIKKYANYKEKDFTQQEQTIQTLINYYKEIYKLAFEEEDLFDWDPTDPEIENDLYFEIYCLQNDIQYEVDQAKQDIVDYQANQKMNQTKLINEQDILMREHLISAGFSKTAMITKSDKEILELFESITIV